MRTNKIYLYALLLSLSVGCTDLRDLYDIGHGVLRVKGFWDISLGLTAMRNATVLLLDGAGFRGKKYLSQPNNATVPVSKGEYDVMVFNGIMESERETNLDHVLFSGTDRLETFEARVAEAAPLKRLSRAEGEYIASNEMEILTFAHHRVRIDEDGAMYVKYHNGTETEDGAETFVAGSIKSTPKAMSFRFQVRLTGIVNPTGARSASGALRGFLGSVFMPASGKRPRPGFSATHHLTLSPPSTDRTRTDADGVEVGTLVSPRFVSFGPPLPRVGEEPPTSGACFFEPVFVLTDGTEYSPGPIDVTQQVNRAISRILEHHGEGDDISHDENIFEIEIDRRITLPVVKNGNPKVDVTPWDDNEVVIVWI